MEVDQEDPEVADGRIAGLVFSYLSLMLFPVRTQTLDLVPELLVCTQEVGPGNKHGSTTLVGSSRLEEVVEGL